MRKKTMIPIALLHLIAGFSLVISGILVYFTNGFEMAMSWVIFGAMYISMSDIGENEMSVEKRNHPSHGIRRLFGYVGAIFGVILMLFYLKQLVF
ncbi:MAG: hypothetical protein AAGH81_14090 [Bacteroidota bacterium]